MYSRTHRAGYRTKDGSNARHSAARPGGAAPLSAPDRRFYARFARQADEILFTNIEWIDACADESFTHDGNARRVLRKIYVPGDPLPLEITVPDKALRLNGLNPGEPIRIKADLEVDKTHWVKLFTAALREAGEPFDIFPDLFGIVDHENTNKGVLHIVVSRNIDFVVPISDVVGRAGLGDCVVLRLARFR